MQNYIFIISYLELVKVLSIKGDIISLDFFFLYSFNFYIQESVNCRYICYTWKLFMFIIFFPRKRSKQIIKFLNTTISSIFTIDKQQRVLQWIITIIIVIYQLTHIAICIYMNKMCGNINFTYIPMNSDVVGKFYILWSNLASNFGAMQKSHNCGIFISDFRNMK